MNIEPEVVPGFPDRSLPRSASAAAELKKRTPTRLYNERPTWLANAHKDLDAAVAAAYGWAVDISEEDALARLLELNLSRAAKSLPEEEPAADELEAVEEAHGGKRPAKAVALRQTNGRARKSHKKPSQG